MPRYERRQEDQRNKRRVIADIVEVLRSERIFDAAGHELAVQPSSHWKRD